jgi:hypothetical protein
VTDQRPECWTITEVAAHLGLTPDGARKQLSRWRITGERHYPAHLVQAHHAARKGSGNWRTSKEEQTVTMNPATRLEELAGVVQNLHMRYFANYLTDDDRALLASTGTTVHHEALTTAEVPIAAIGRGDVYAADLLEAAAQYRRYVASGCHVRGEGLRWFSAWMEAGSPGDPQEWQHYLDGAEVRQRAARSARRSA